MNSLKRLASPLFVILVCVGISSWNTFSQGVIDTTGGATAFGLLANFGRGGSTMGQTFIAPSDRLYFFSFWVNPGYGDPLKYAGYVAPWDGTHLTGQILYESPVQTQSGLGTQQIIFDTGGIPLTPGQQYIAFLSAAGIPDGPWGNGYVGYMGRDTYPPGGAFLGSGSDFTQLFQRSWQYDNGWDLAFQALFYVPEPTSGIYLLGAGIFLLRSVRRRMCKRHD